MNNRQKYNRSVMFCVFIGRPFFQKNTRRSELQFVLQFLQPKAPKTPTGGFSCYVRTTYCRLLLTIHSAFYLNARKVNYI